jgi:hypothetical protein
MKYLKIAIVLLFCLATALPSVAQDYKPVDFSLQLKNKHLWRGYEVTDGALTSVTLSLKDKSGSFNVGLWGGAGFDGDYQEFDYFVSYSKSGFSIALWDIYNFANDRNAGGIDIFNYNKRTTGHFLDLSVGYTLQGSYPLSLSWATIIQGCDGPSATSDDNRYSTYVSADFPVIRSDAVNVNFGIGAAFALSPDEGTDMHFYSGGNPDKGPGIVNLNVSAAKKVQIGSVTLPVSVLAMFNPLLGNANLQFAVDIF